MSIMPLVSDIIVRRFKKNKAWSERLANVISIFKQQFGEEYIDVQPLKGDDDFITSYISGSSISDRLRSLDLKIPVYQIIIRIPRETVTNELGLSTTIYDLFIKLEMTRAGTLQHGVRYLRSTFTENQLFSHYIHSHCTRLDYSNLGEWHSVCTGSGPINNSFRNLSLTYTPLEAWYGFIAELRQIVRIESLDGGPYIRMESIMGPFKPLNSVNPKGVRGIFRAGDSQSSKALIKSYILSKNLKLGFLNGRFCLGETFVEWLIGFTEYAKEWGKINNKTINFEKVTLKDNVIYAPDGNTTQGNFDRMNGLIGNAVITFKGTVYKLKIMEDDSTRQVRELISPAVGATILTAMLNTLNNWYGKTTTDDTNIGYL